MKQINIFFFLFYAGLFFLLAIVSLNTNYVEGDDASTILFHLFEGDSTIQQPYSAYHSGMDLLLSFLPQDERILRTFSIWTSFVAGFFVIFLLFFWVNNFYIKNRQLAITFGLLLPFIIPELLFVSLLFNPTNIGLLFCLLALIALEYFFKYRKLYYLLFIPLALMIAIPFRWSLLMFMATYFGIYLYRRNDLRLRLYQNDFIFISVLLLSLGASIFGIIITGYSIKDILDVFLWGKGYISDKEFSLTINAATGLSFITPSLTLLLIIGFFKSASEIKRNSLLLFISLIPFFILGFFPSLKFSASVLPILILFSALALGQLVNNKKIVLVTIITLTFLPWIFGISIVSNKFSYGPGFEINQWHNQNKSQPNLESKNPDSRMTKLSWRIGLNAGFAMPTLEGPRPLYGYADALFAGKWYRIIEDNAQELKELLKLMEENQINTIVQGRKNARFQCLLFKQGYSSNMPYKKIHQNYYFRDFSKGEQKIRLIFPINSSEIIKSFEEISTKIERFGIYLSYSSEATNLSSQKNIKRLGLYTLIKL